MHDNNNKNMISALSWSPLVLMSSCPLTTLVFPHKMPMIHPHSERICLITPPLPTNHYHPFSWAVNSSRVSFFFFFFQRVPTMRLCLLLRVLADTALAHITPSSSDHSQSVLAEQRWWGGLVGGGGVEERLLRSYPSSPLLGR